MASGVTPKSVASDWYVGQKSMIALKLVGIVLSGDSVCELLTLGLIVRTVKPLPTRENSWHTITMRNGMPAADQASAARMRTH